MPINRKPGAPGGIPAMKSASPSNGNPGGTNNNGRRVIGKRTPISTTTTTPTADSAPFIVQRRTFGTALPADIAGLLTEFSRPERSLDGSDDSIEASLLNLDLQSEPKAGKTELLAGNERCIIAKLPDGSQAGAGLISRPRAEINNRIGSLAQFYRWLDAICEIAATHGTDGRFACIAIDPIRILLEWMAIREVKRYNDKCDDPEERIYHISDMRRGGVHGKIADEVGSIITRVNSLGWGVHTSTHYAMKPDWEPGQSSPKGSSWKPEIYPTTAAVIAQRADILAVPTRIATPDMPKPSYHIEFQTGGRLPMGIEGCIDLPQYLDDKTGRLVSWDYFEREFQAALARWKANRTLFSRVQDQGQE